MSKQIDRFTYFLLGLRDGSYEWKSWILRTFSASNLLDEKEAEIKFKKAFDGAEFHKSEKNYPYELFNSDGVLAFFDPKSGDKVTIKNSSTTEALLDINETIVCPKGIVPNIKEETLTTTGRLLFNQLACVFAFKEKIDFINDTIHFSDIEKVISKNMRDMPEDPNAPLDRAFIYPSDMNAYYIGTGMLSGLNGISVPSATPYTLTPSPLAVAKAKELFERDKDKLNDPIVAARNWAEIAKLDKEYVKQDPNYGFLISGKSMNVARKKMFYCYGEEYSMDGTEMTFISKPLSKGLDLDNIVAIQNGNRDGSFSRGALTALAGESTKNAVRATTGVTVDMEDCGTKLTLRVMLYESTASQYLGSVIIVDGAKVILTEENISDYIGKYVDMRNAGHCNNPENDICLTCAGMKFKGRENTISAETSMVTNAFMGTFMSKMHGNVYELEKYNLDTAFT